MYIYVIYSPNSSDEYVWPESALSCLLTIRLLPLHCDMARAKTYSTVEHIMALYTFSELEPRQFRALIGHFGEPSLIQEATTEELLELDGIDETLAVSILSSAGYLDEAHEKVELYKAREIGVIGFTDPTYPRILDELNDPPPLLYLRGQLPQPEKRTLAIVGAAQGSAEGIELTVRLAEACAKEGVQVVSSLHRGIDTAAHVGVRSGDGNSFAVIENGLDHIELKEQMPVAIDIAQSGGVISEYPPDREYHHEQSEAANRLLVGLSQAVVVTEAYNDSQRVLDIVSFCNQIGKLSFFLINPEHGALSDKETLDKLGEFGCIPISGFDKLPDIFLSLV